MTAALPNDLFVVAVAFYAIVAAVVVRMPVTIVFAVGFVVAVDVADGIAQREAVVRSDKVYARNGSAPTGFEDVCGAVQAPGQDATLAGVTAPELSNVITIDVVPLSPARREVPKLIAARARVPGLGDKFGVSKALIVADVEQ